MTESGLGLNGRTTIVGMNGTGVMEATESGKIVVGIVKDEDDYYDDYHYGGSRGDREGWDDYYEDRHQDYTTRIVVGIITKKMTVQDGEIGVIKTIKTTSGMVGRAGVADVDCLAKVRWLTQ